jgi:hypothetical protein
MPPERQYESNAERQAAYRARHRERQPPPQALLAALARSLHGSLARTVQQGQSKLPAELLGHRADQTLQNLIRYLHTDPTEQ